MRTIKICPDCGRVHVAGYYTNVPNVWGFKFKNMITRCNHIHEFETDEDMIPILTMLWDKGYIIIRSCGGIDNNPSPDSIYVTVKYALKYKKDFLKEEILFRFEEANFHSMLSINWETDNDPNSSTFTISSNSINKKPNRKYEYEGKNRRGYMTSAIDRFNSLSIRYDMLAILMKCVINLPAPASLRVDTK